MKELMKLLEDYIDARIKVGELADATAALAELEGGPTSEGEGS